MLMFVAAVAIAVLAFLIWHAIVVTPSDVQLTVFDVEVQGLPAAFDGYRIAVLADFHHGPQQPLARARRAVALANSQGPHLVALLGDYGTSEPFAPALSRRWYQRTFRQLGPVLQQLRATDGIVAVVGNHDYYAGASETIEWLRGLGIRVLRGEAMDLPSTEGSLRIVGMDDFEEGGVETEEVAALLQGETPTIVLSHHPDAAQHCQAPCVRFVLSGHTHGGQVVLPWVGAMVTRSTLCPPAQPSGWVANPHAPLFVTRGIGAQVPVRFGAPPEVVALTLRRPAGAQGREPSIT